MRLLHIDNNEMFSKKIKKIVEDNDVVYISSDSYEKAYEIITDIKVDLLIIAEQIGDYSCKDFIEKLQLEKSTVTPVIVISDEQDYDKKSVYFDMGIMSYLTKSPFSNERFEKYIQTIKNDLSLIDELKYLSIAVVDDSSFSLGVISRFFNRYDIKNVDYFQNSYEFMETEKHYDIYIIDYVMPGFDGEDLIYKIREKNLDAIIIIVTGHESQKIITHSLNIGADDFILKPLDIKLFMLRIVSCIRQQKLNKENVDKSKLLFNMATKDMLTGLCNRNYFLELYEKKTSESIRSGEPLAVILMDIDHFKSINDQYGHLKGDYVLSEIAKILNKNLRASDTICRWGGEEFLILCSRTDKEKALIVAEKLRREIESHVFENINTITSSFGVTQWQVGDNQEKIFRRMDNSLYLAKLTGRNKVVFDEEITILQNEAPSNIEWGAFFRSGNVNIDMDHHELIVISNEIIRNCFLDHREEFTKILFDKLIDLTDKHFKNEEDILKLYNYEGLGEHKDIHEDFLQKALIVQKNLNDGDVNSVDVAKYLIQDMIVGHIVKHDFDFFHVFETDMNK
ncbi:diguanylate cyclase [Proteocatella sphenisci]|uniref:diguanylate cyclase n=1 Tax=Proteocatella sphenisci TaxID=181070 RepID=UPI00048E3182|nr:diguanylate cyclase [Proteocatella sphenisci]